MPRNPSMYYSDVRQLLEQKNRGPISTQSYDTKYVCSQRKLVTLPHRLYLLLLCGNKSCLCGKLKPSLGCFTNTIINVCVHVYIWYGKRGQNYQGK